MEAAGVAAYVLVFAIGVQALQSWFTFHNAFPNSVATLVIFLLAFIVSAIFCGFLICVYPVRLYLERGLAFHISRDFRRPSYFYYLILS